MDRKRQSPPHWPVWLKASVLVHVAAAGPILIGLRFWPWSLAAVLVNHAVLAAAGLLPRSRLLGPNWTRLPCVDDRVALTIDDGPDPAVTPAVLDLLASHGAHATFFCIGERVARHPELARRITREGHEIGNHTAHHRHTFALSGPASIHREIAAAQASILTACQVAPRYFRAPAGLRNPFLQPALSELRLELASWTRRGFDTVNANGEVVLRRLTRNLEGGDILLLHDGGAARASDGTAVILAVLPRLLAVLAGRQLRCVTLSEGLSGVECRMDAAGASSG
ncbi:MAG TPA: polysaccharide deacetylase family protein [Steroidobacteraceae bacterium]|nr:polysaccharide deacetylase family protein [Steroidobacteraceae bacterium]